MVVGGRELIDTLWNVNYKGVTKYSTGGFELIDTLWNVNRLWSNAEAGIPGINRYIMECK